MQSLPIEAKREDIVSALAENQVIVVVGETGSGKTTMIPLYLLKAGYSEDGLIGVTQPRRPAATSVAKYVAGKTGSSVGQEIGYKIRFTDETTQGTKVKFMTDGILLREMQTDPDLTNYRVIMVDEAHERSMNIDLLLGLLKRLLERRPDLKVLITSATIDSDKFSAFFGGAPVINVTGRTYPVEINYLDEEIAERDIPEVVVKKVIEIDSLQPEGDMLVFMTGQDDIRQVSSGLEEKHIPNLEILPIYGDMPTEEQERIFMEYPGKRKVVIATNIAETSLTVDGVVYVIDPGLIKQTDFDHETGIGILKPVKHSKAGCNQRAGRAGRTQPGVCYRLFTEANYAERREFTKPEILRTELAGVVLHMKSIGIKDVEGFEFVDQPDPQAFHAAHQTLISLGALTKGNGLTDIGRVMAKLPLEPRIGRMIVAASEFHCVEEIVTIAAGLSVRTVFIRPKEREKQYGADLAHSRFKESDSDFLTMLKVWEGFQDSNYSYDWCRDNFLRFKALQEMRQIRSQLFQILKRAGINISSMGERSEARHEAISKAVASGLVENLCQSYGMHAYSSRDRYEIYIHPSSAMFHLGPQLLVCGEMVNTSKTFARNCQAVEPEWFEEIAPHLFRKEVTEPHFSSLHDGIITDAKYWLGDHGLIAQKWQFATGEKAVMMFCEALVRQKFHFWLTGGLDFVEDNLKLIDQVAYGDSDREELCRKLESWYFQRLVEWDVVSVRKLRDEIQLNGLDLELRSIGELKDKHPSATLDDEGEQVSMDSLQMLRDKFKAR